MVQTGIDVSNNNGTIGWDRALADPRVGFVIAKGTEGVGFLDKFLAYNLSAVRGWTGDGGEKKGAGAYGFGRPSVNQPEDEAAVLLRYLDAIGGLRPGELPWLDMEDEDVPVGVSVLEWSLRWLGFIEDKILHPPGIYTYPWYAENHGIAHDARLAKYPLWWASPDLARYPAPPAWGGQYALWQKVTTWRIPGIAGDVDGNELAGSLADFVALGLPHPQPAAVPNPDPATGKWIHEYFLPTWTLEEYGHPLEGAYLYDDSVTRQLFENGIWGSNGRAQPRKQGTGQSLFYMTGGRVPDWPTIHPLGVPDAGATAHPVGAPGTVQ
jgi:GH25 family lysozyme M1 (1,4-beta-N-acetylmuramidase)